LHLSRYQRSRDFLRIRIKIIILKVFYAINPSMFHRAWNEIVSLITSIFIIYSMLILKWKNGSFVFIKILLTYLLFHLQGEYAQPPSLDLVELEDETPERLHARAFSKNVFDVQAYLISSLSCCISTAGLLLIIYHVYFNS